MRITLIGIDVATQADRTGLATGALDDGRLTVTAVAGRATADDLVAAVAAAPGPVLVCLDAPLGWPLALAPALADHAAGQPLAPSRDELFWRETDRVVHAVTGKRPLLVAADLLAHTAWQALRLLDAMRAARPLPLLLDPADLGGGGGAVEVYPGALLAALGLPSRGYKAGRGADARAALVEALPAHGLSLRGGLADRAIASADALDAALCLLLGATFLRGDCVHWRDHGVDVERVRREGWMWVPAARGPTPG